MRQYQGVSIGQFPREQQKEVLKVDTFLRDISIALSSTADAIDEAPVASPSNISYVTINNSRNLTRERRLVVTSPITKTDNGPNNSVDIGLNISALNPLLDHGLLETVSLTHDDHGQYIHNAPTTDARNTITPAGTLDMGLQVLGNIGIDAALMATGTDASRRGLWFPGRASILSDSGGDLSTSPFQMAVNTLWGASNDNNNQDETADSIRMNMFAPEGTWLAANPMFQLILKSRDGQASVGPSGLDLSNRINIFEAQVGPDGRGKFLFGAGEAGQPAGTTRNHFTNPNPRVFIDSDGADAAEMPGLVIWSTSNADQDGIPLLVETDGAATVTDIAHFIAGHHGSNPSIMLSGQETYTQTVGGSTTATMPYTTTELPGGQIQSAAGLPRLKSRNGSDGGRNLRISCQSYIWADNDTNAAAKSWGGVRFGNHYIMGVHRENATSELSDLIKLWTIGAGSNPDTETPRFSIGSIEGVTGSVTGFLGTDNTTTNSGLGYTFTSASPFTFELGTDISLTYGPASGTAGSLGFVGTGTTSNTFNVVGPSGKGYAFDVNESSGQVAIAMSGVSLGIRTFGVGGDGDFTLTSDGDIIFTTSGAYKFQTATAIDFEAVSSVTLRTTAVGADITVQSDQGDVLLNAPLGVVTITDTTSTLLESTASSIDLKRDTVLEGNGSTAAVFTIGDGATAGDPTHTFAGATQSAALVYDDSEDEFNFTAPVVGIDSTLAWMGL